MTVVAMVLLDRVGRRPLLIGGMLVMAIALAVLGLAFALTGLAGSLGAIAVASMMVYVGAFAVSLGPIFWLLIAEIYPLRIRGRAMGVATTANWASNLLVSLTFLTLTQVFGASLTFWLYALLTVAALVFAYKLVPETKGRTLEAIERFWHTPQGVRSETDGPTTDILRPAA
jgi:MFS family permease